MSAVHIIGAGGIGCAVGYALRAAGAPVTFVETNWLKVEAGQHDGVRVDERPALSAEFVLFQNWTPDPAALVLLCTKCYDNAAVLAKLPPGVRLLPIQNGFDPVLDAHGHAVEGIASFVSECAGDRPHTRITREGELHIGARHLTPQPLPLGGKGGQDRRDTDPPHLREDFSLPSLLGKGAGGFGSAVRVLLVPQIAPIKYTKLMYNAAISPLAAAAGIDNGALLSVPAARKLFFALLQENYAILRASGIELGTVGPFHPRTVVWILRRKWLARVMARFFEPSLRGTYCSMAGEIEKGRTELDNYTGHLLRLAAASGAPCPLNTAVYALVSEMTAARARPRPEVLARLT
ncbi:MAG: ketopantoate reductase family protein [Planctomycetes bacterium]|nr:ketopantoate reductase family protein [Planctomycetota bacterium]